MPKVVRFTRMRERKTLSPWASAPPGKVRRWRPGRRWRWPNKQWLAWGAIGFVVVGLVAAEFGFRAAGCDIKGNISHNTGERIYHVPGQTYYAETWVNFLTGERFFCSEAAARKAGWRRAKI